MTRGCTTARPGWLASAIGCTCTTRVCRSFEGNALLQHRARPENKGGRLRRQRLFSSSLRQRRLHPVLSEPAHHVDPTVPKQDKVWRLNRLKEHLATGAHTKEAQLLLWIGCVYLPNKSGNAAAVKIPTHTDATVKHLALWDQKCPGTLKDPLDPIYCLSCTQKCVFAQKRCNKRHSVQVRSMPMSSRSSRPSRKTSTSFQFSRGQSIPACQSGYPSTRQGS